MKTTSDNTPAAALPSLPWDNGRADTPLDPVGQVAAAAHAHFRDSRGSHDWDHTLRVVRLCEHIGPEEGADMGVLLMAAFLHDIGRSRQDAANGAVCHAAQGALMAAPLLAPLALAETRRENILHCIRSHRFRRGEPPRTVEARVLFDADKLDAIGAVGVARAFLFAGEVGARLHNPEADIEKTRPYSQEDTGYREYRLKLCRIQDRILTDAGRRIARKRHAFMEAFFNRLQAEHDGKR